MKTSYKKVRLLIGTNDLDALREFYWSVIREHSDKLSQAVQLWISTESPNLVTLLAYFSKLDRKEKHWDFLNTKTFGRFQTFYAAKDELLETLQDPVWRSNFEDAYSLWLQYGALFITTLQYPKEVSKLLSLAGKRTEENKTDRVALERVGITVYRGLTSTPKLLEWHTNQVQ